MSHSLPPAMGRRAVIRSGAAAGLAALLAGCSSLFDDDSEAPDTPDDEPTTDQTGGAESAEREPEAPDPADVSEIGSVIVVGAGAAGMSAAALLRRAGVDVRVLEASTTYGGRIRHDLDFVDFPIPLGAEWLHEDPDELEIIAGGPVEIELVAYQPDDEVASFDGSLMEDTMGDDLDHDLKFVGTTWLGFFETYVLPEIEDTIDYGVEVVNIDHRDDVIRVIDRTGEVHEADRVIVTVPLKLLQERRVEFDPPLPESHRDAISNADIWGGMKVFIEFSERFYPVFLAFPDSDTDDGQRLYYDAAYGQETDTNVLGLFAVGRPAERYQSLDEGDELRDAILAELDDVFDGAATPHYVQHRAQNWSTDPFARSAYLADDADWRTPSRLQERFSDRVFLAGDAYTGHDDWSAVDDAARSARDAVRDLLR